MARLKRMSAPKIWNFPRKTKERFTFSPSPGPHAAEKCMTLGFVLRDVLGATSTAKESRELVSKKIVKVDGIVRKDLGYPLGLMDLLTVGEDNWRVLPNKRGLHLHPVKGDEKNMKLLKVKDKTFVRGKVQLNFHDGRNMIVDKDSYKTGDVVVFEFDTKKIKDVLQFKRGALCIVVDGKLRGTLGKVEEIMLVRGITPNKVVLKTGNVKLETLKDYIFIVGHEKPVVSLAETKAEKIAEAVKQDVPSERHTA